MKRNLIALAFAAVLAAPVAQADTANVNVYGTLNLSYGSYKVTGTTGVGEPASLNRLTCNSCNFGIKGTEDLSDGMKVMWQVENSVGGAGGFNAGAIASRNTGVGLQGNWGTFMLGQWDTPYKLLNVKLEPTWATGTGYMIPTMDTPGGGGLSATYSALGVTGNTDVSFSRRQNSSLWYISPKFSGVDGTLMYSGNGAKNLTNGNPFFLSAALRYDEGMIMAGFAYETHVDARTTGASVFPVLANPTAGTTDTGMKLMAAVKPIDGLTVGGSWGQLNYKNKIAAGDDSYKKSAFLASVLYDMDKWGFAAAFGSAGNGTCTLASGAACTVTDTGASQLTIKAGYSYSKRTDVYLAWTKISNAANGQYSWALAADATAPYATMPVAGGLDSDPSWLGIGVRHTF